MIREIITESSKREQALKELTKVLDALEKIDKKYGINYGVDVVGAVGDYVDKLRESDDSDVMFEANQPVFVSEFYSSDGEYVKVVYIKAKNVQEAKKKISTYKIKGYKLDKTATDKLGDYSDLEDYETSEFKGDFAEFKPEYNEPN